MIIHIMLPGQYRPCIASGPLQRLSRRLWPDIPDAHIINQIRKRVGKRSAQTPVIQIAEMALKDGADGKLLAFIGSVEGDLDGTRGVARAGTGSGVSLCAGGCW